MNDINTDLLLGIYTAMLNKEAYNMGLISKEAYKKYIEKQMNCNYELMHMRTSQSKEQEDK